MGRIYDRISELSEEVSPSSEINILLMKEVEVVLSRVPSLSNSIDDVSQDDFSDEELAFLVPLKEISDHTDEHRLSFWAKVEIDFIHSFRASVPSGTQVSIVRFFPRRGSLIVEIAFLYITGKIAAKGVDLFVDGSCQYFSKTIGRHLEIAFKRNLPRSYAKMNDIHSHVEGIHVYLQSILSIDSINDSSKPRSYLLRAMTGLLIVSVSILLVALIADLDEISLYEYFVDSIGERFLPK